MRAVQVVEAIGPDGVRVVDVPEPDPAGLVVVDLDAAGVSFPDLLQTSGSYQVVRPVPFTPGVEGAGTVRDAPSDSGFRSGDRVAVLAFGGAWQRTVAVPAAAVFRLPDAVSLTAGAGFLMNYFTAHFALTERAGCRPGDTVLVHGAAGGLGTASLQVAAALGLDTIAVVSTEEKGRVAAAHRATHTVLADGFKGAVTEITGGRGVDIVLDPVGGDRFLDSLRSLAVGGRHVVLGFTGGEIPTVKVNRLLLKNISVLGAGWGEYLREDLGYPARQWAELEPLLASGVLRVAEPVLHPIGRAADALRSLESRGATGKVALDLRP
ncbi:NADPH:quinone oxidoreductase family protein [Rhodococcus sp. NPDC054953]